MNLVLESTPSASQSPCSVSDCIFSRILWFVLWPWTHLRLELDKLEAAAVKLENVLRLGRLDLRVGLCTGLDRSRGLSLLDVSACFVVIVWLVLHARGNDNVLACPQPTLQFLHFQTKLASPRPPLISFCSCVVSIAVRNISVNSSSKEDTGMVYQRTKRLTPTQLACVSRQDVHWTLNVYQNGASSVSAGRRLVTL